jgi:acetoacetate decarboxylase
MGFVKSPQEIEAIEARLRNPRFLKVQVLQVQFETHSEVVRALLPPPLTPSHSPTVFARIGYWQSNCVGDFAGGGVYISAMHGDVLGIYVLAMYMDSDSAVMFGRDTFGEPKKLAGVRLSHTSRQVAGSIVRHGVELIAADVSLENDDGPVNSTSWAFNVKSWPSADGTGLQSDALLAATKFDTELWTNWSGVGTLRFGATAHDPLGEIPIVRILQAGYYEGDH